MNFCLSVSLNVRWYASLSLFLPLRFPAWWVTGVVASLHTCMSVFLSMGLGYDSNTCSVIFGQ